MKEIDRPTPSPEAQAVQQLDALAQKLFQDRPADYKSGEGEGAVEMLQSPRGNGTFLERRIGSQGTVGYNYSIQRYAGNKSGEMYARWQAKGDTVTSGIYSELQGILKETNLNAANINALRKHMKDSFRLPRGTRAGFIGRLTMHRPQ